MKVWGLVGQLDSLHHWHMASYSGDCGQWKEQGTAAKILTCISDTLLSMTQNTTCPVELLQMNHTVVHIWCNSMWQRHLILCPNMHSSILLIFTWKRVFYGFIGCWIMREDSNQRVAQGKKKKKAVQNKRTPRYILVKLFFQCRNCTIFFEL